MNCTKEQLIEWAEELYGDLIACERSRRPGEVRHFLGLINEIHEDLDYLASACARAGYTLDEITDACD